MREAQGELKHEAAALPVAWMKDVAALLRGLADDATPDPAAWHSPETLRRWADEIDEVAVWPLDSDALHVAYMHGYAAGKQSANGDIA